MSSKTRKLKAQQANLFHVLEGNPKLLDLLETATSSARKAIFIKSLLAVLPTAFAHFDTGKQDEDMFALFTAWYGGFNNSNALFPGISAATEHRKEYLSEKRLKKLQFISDIGLDMSAEDKNLFFSKVNSACDLIGKSSFLF
jgi:hypothetical protein